MSSSFSTPRVFAHSARPEWGRAVIAQELDDRTTYVFESGGERTFMNAGSRLHEVELPPEEREALAKTLLRHRGSSKTKGTSKKSAKTKARSISFEQQDAMFRARFGEGFTDERYVQEVRGASPEDARNVDAIVALARELFAKERLDEAIARGAFHEVHGDAQKILAASKRLAFAEVDDALVDEMPASAHEKLARALRELLHGDGAYPKRFNAFVKSLAPKGVPWSVATIFAAVVHPETHVLVDPASSQRQARVLGVKEPTNGAPTGATYAKHLAVAQALRERLVEAGRAPRDLFDVHAYSLRTLGASTAS